MHPKFLYFLFAFSLFWGCSENQKKPQQTTETVLVHDTIVSKDSTFSTQCFYTDLSHQYNYNLTYYEHFGSDTVRHWTVEIFDKKNNPLDSIISPYYVFYRDFVNFSEVRSYRNGKNKHEEVADGYYGNFVIADFNFDGSDDFAIINDIGGSAGPYYNYYLSNNENRFAKDAFLTDSVEFFPEEILRNKKRLITRVVSGSCWINEHTYQYNIMEKEWSQISIYEFDVCNKKKSRVR